MTFDQYIANPMGRKNSVFSHREMYRELYGKKLDAIMVRENGKVQYELYNEDDKIYYAHIKVPSEVVENFYYDVVIKFYTNNNTVASDRSLKNYNVEFFSNDPSFVYTFAHAFLKNKLFIKELVPRMSKQAVKKAAIEKNPSNEVGYVKAIYFTYLIMTNYGLFNKVKYEVYGNKFNKKVLLSNIIHSDIKIEERQIKSESESKKKKKEESKKKETLMQRGMNLIGNSLISRRSSTTKKTNMVSKSLNTVKKTNKISRSKSLNTVKRIKKI